MGHLNPIPLGSAPLAFLPFVFRCALDDRELTATFLSRYRLPFSNRINTAYSCLQSSPSIIESTTMPIAVSAPTSPLAPVFTKSVTAGSNKQMVQSREDSVYLAKLAEQAERYEGMSLSFFFSIEVQN